MQKIKNLLHHNDNTTTTGTHPTTTPASSSDPIVHDHGIPLPNTLVTGNTVTAPMGTTSAAPRAHDSLDKNKDGRVDAADFQGKGTSTTHHNPLDRNHDGKVDLKDLKPSAKREAPINDQKLASLDKNHDGRVDARDFQGQTAGISSVRAEPAQVQVIEKGTVVHEHVHTLEKEEIQPIIHREREQLDVHQVTQQLHETQIQPTLVQRRELAAEVRAPIIEKSAPIQENIAIPSVDRDATMKSTQINAPIVEETIRKTVIEEIQPVLDRDVVQSTLIQERKDIYEKVVEAPSVTRSTTYVQDRGIVSGGSLESLTSQGFNLGTFQQGQQHNPLDRNHDGRVDAADFSGGQQGFGQKTANPLDRNNDGKVDLKDLSSKPVQTL
jgi:hypothetical protein